MTDVQRSAEYDAFGPWVLPVSDLEAVPRVFRSHPIDFAAASTVLKVPRDIARRDADPSMQLYDRLLVLDRTGLLVLTRDGDDFSVARIEADAVVAVDTGNELLEGWLVVHGIDGTTLSVPFSASSAARMTALADRLIAMAGGARRGDGSGDGRGEQLPLDALGESDVALVKALLRTSAGRPGLRVLAAYPGTSPRSSEPLLHRLRPGRLRLSGGVLCGDADHVLLLSRRRWLHRQTKPDLSERRIVLVRTHVSGVSTVPHPVARGVVAATIEGGAARIELALPDAPEVLTAIDSLRPSAARAAP